MTLSRAQAWFARAAALALLACPLLATASPPPTPEEARRIAREAYVWGYPSVDLYNILLGQALDRTSPEFRAPLNAVGHARTVATPEDTAVIAPNVDTPYSYAWLDLRSGPVVVTLPAFEANRYVSLQLFDMYTWIIDYVTPRTRGRAGGHYLITPPGWSGEVPAGIDAVFPSTTTLALGLFRTQWLGGDDLRRVHAIQDGFRVAPLAAWQGKPAPALAPLPPRVAPLNLRQAPTAPEFLTVLGWMTRFMPPLEDERALRADFARIGLHPDGGFDMPADPALRAAIIAGLEDGLRDVQARATQVKSSAELFGTRAFLGQDYTTRATGAMLGILGNAAEEFLGVGYLADAKGRPFDGSRRYTIRFAPGTLPPVDAFWSITAYTPEKLLYANPLRRYVINSTMLQGLQRDADGGITLYVQHEAPGGARDRNWLPVPAGAFGLTFRTYLPHAEIREGRWTAPPVQPMDE